MSTKRFLPFLALTASVSVVSLAHAASKSVFIGNDAWPGVVLVDPNTGAPVANPGGGGSVTAAGTNGTQAQAVQGINGGVALPTLDANGAAFSSAVAMTSGTATAPGRSVGIVCTTAGNIVLTLSGGTTITMPIYVGWNLYPFAATAFAFSGGGAGSVYNLT